LHFFHKAAHIKLNVFFDSITMAFVITLSHEAQNLLTANDHQRRSIACPVEYIDYSVGTCRAFLKTYGPFTSVFQHTISVIFTE
jgi:hypothetical protein